MGVEGLVERRKGLRKYRSVVDRGSWGWGARPGNAVGGRVKAGGQAESQRRQKAIGGVAS